MSELIFVSQCETKNVPDGDYYALRYVESGFDQGWHLLHVSVIDGIEQIMSVLSRHAEELQFRNLMTDADKRGIEIIYVAWDGALTQKLAVFHERWPNFDADPDMINDVLLLPNLVAEHLSVVKILQY